MTVKRPAHKQSPPNECGTCVKIDSILRQHHRKALGQPLTGAALAAAAGIARRNVLVHVAYLVSCGWLEANGRTPVVPRPATATTAAASKQRPALKWATDLSLSCRTCGRLMVALASQAGEGEWFVQLTEAELAAALSIAVRTVRDHVAALTGRRPHANHAQEAPLLRGERLPESKGYGGLRWVFLDGKKRDGSLTELYSKEEYRALRSIALDILAQAPLITAKMTARERTGAAELLLIERLHVGYPPAELLAAMTDPRDNEKTVKGHAYGLIQWRLDQNAPKYAYVAKAQDTFDPTPVWHDCPCGKPIREPAHVTLCKNCQRREAAGISLDVELEAEAREYRRLRGLPV
ncbi:hypothetical protein [Streptomyces virginiae]|uniref:hypothetical protein n=1 Tax=Streptomyces virginiae TaxID=1961 RepID=UPI00324D9A35